tara:strand:- start:2794 stop:3669 length:876 start_codon:yes stop_codon:yes gene_type:complete
MRILKSLSSLLLFICLAFNSKAQNFQGIAIYHTATSLDMDMKVDSSKLNPEMEQRMAMIKQRMAKAMQKEYELKFNKTESSYTEVETLDEGDTPGRRGGGMRIFANIMGSGGSYYKNISSKVLLEQTDLYGKQFLITDSLTDWKWKLGKESKKIGSYTCYKATATRIMKTATFSRGADGESEQKETEVEQEIVAWWTPEIPISQGPKNFWGLPGLIMELNDGRTTMVCSKVVLNPKEKVEIKVLKDGKKVSSEEYAKIMREKMEEMQEVYGGRGGKGRGGRRGGSFTIEMR